MAEIILKPNSGFKRLYFNNLDTLKSINLPDCEMIESCEFDCFEECGGTAILDDNGLCLVDYISKVGSKLC